MDTLPLIYETPPRPKDGHVVGPQDDLGVLRRANLKDTGSVVLEVPIDLFFNHVLPPLHRNLKDVDAVERVIDTLKLGPNPIYTGEDWCEMVKKQAEDATEKNIYAGMEAIANAIQAAVTSMNLPNPVKQVTKYKDSPDSAPISIARTSTHRPDGFFQLCEKQEPDGDYWVDVAAVGEFKRKDNREAVNADIRQLLWDMHHILREDERRRFTFGFNIEKREMRLWYISRADILVCDAFDIVQHPDRLVHFFLVFMYSSPHRLGRDTSMEYVRATDSEDGQRHLLITVKSHDGKSTIIYRTLEILSNVGTEAIRGRGTRVWRVEGMKKNGQPLSPRETFVLKDSWMDADREHEGAILAEIREVATKLESKVLLSALLTVETYGDVWIESDGSNPDDCGPYLDQTLPQDIRDLVCPNKDKRFVIQKPAIVEKTEARLSQLQSQAAGNANSVHQHSDPVQRLVIFSPKKHTRIVFLEDCRPIHEERSLEKALTIISKTCDVLRALHHAGWVHRDISGGNVLVHGDDVKLADFEYAKKFDEMKTAAKLGSTKPHPIRTGTPDYMSVEVEEGEFCFQDDIVSPSDAVQPVEPQDKPPESYPRDPSQLGARGPPPDRGFSVVQQVPEDRIVWQYYPLNDVESLMWLCDQLTINRDIYFTRKPYPEKETYCPEGYESPEARIIRIKHQAEVANSLSYGHRDRVCFMTFKKSHVMTKALSTLHPILRSKDPENPNEWSVAWGLEQFKTLLREAYRNAERDPSSVTNLVSWSLCYKLAGVIWKARCSIALENYLVCIRPLGPEIHKIKVAEAAKAAQEAAARAPPKTPRKPRGQAAPSVAGSEAGTAKRKRTKPSNAGTSQRAVDDTSEFDGDGEEGVKSPTIEARERKKRRTKKKL